MSRRGRRSIQGELRGLVATLLFAAVAYWFFASGLYITVVTEVAGWYAHQITPLPGLPSELPAPS